MKKHVIGGFIIEETDDKILMKWEDGINSQIVEGIKRITKKS